jgi:hypothetical protein
MLEVKDWKPPVSLADAEDRLRECRAAVQEIQSQLGKPGKRRQKQKLSPELYSDWEYRTKWALTNRLQDLRLLKQWINNYWRQKAERASA